MITIAIANQKGGVGKTTLTLNLSQLLAQKGRRVLAIDMDYQTNLTYLWNVEPHPERTIFQVLAGKPVLTISDVIVPVADHSLVPGSPVMNSLDVVLAQQPYRDDRLKRALLPLADSFDYALLDCPPSFALATTNALIAATGVLIPTIPDFVCLKSTADFVTNLAEFRRDWNPDLRILGVVPNHCEDRTAHHQGGLKYLDELAATWGTELLPDVKHTTKVREASGNYLSLVDYEYRIKGPLSDAAVALQDIAERIDGHFFAGRAA